jgi:hypothetical protein
MSYRKTALLLAGVMIAVVAAKSLHFADPQFWDENTYVRQARLIAEARTHWEAYHAMEFIRPPLYTLLLALPTWLGHPSITWMHAITCLVVVLLIPVTFALTRRLGGSARAGFIAVALLVATPLFIAQAGLAESDGPTTLLSTLAWLMLLDGRIAAFVVLAIVGVWTKESAYFLSGPAALLLYARSGPLTLGGLLEPRRLAKLWPAAVPGLALIAWLYCHRLLLGVAIPHVNNAMMGPSGLPEALLHNCILDGRIVLFGLACYAARRATYAVADEAHLGDVRLTLVAALSLPFFFMAPLARYMMPSLPLLCALAALTLDALPRRRALATTASVAFLMFFWWGHRIYSNHGHYFDRNLGYRALLNTQAETVRAIAAEHPRGVLATFPLYEALSGPPSNHFLEAPVPAHLVTGDEPLATLCAHDFLIRPTQGMTLDHAVDELRAVAALTPWRDFGDTYTRIVVYRVHCR